MLHLYTIQQHKNIRQHIATYDNIQQPTTSKFCRHIMSYGYLIDILLLKVCRCL